MAQSDLAAVTGQVLRSFSASSSGVPVDEVTLPTPPGTAHSGPQRDTLVAFIGALGETGCTPPEGWGLVQEQQARNGAATVWTYAKVADHEPDSWTWTFDSPVPHWAWVGAYVRAGTA